jgi:hypothetical protein
MRTGQTRVRDWWLVAAIGGLMLCLAGCDPTLQATIENGIISLSTGLFGAFLRALVELAGETGTAGTAQALGQVVLPALA